MNRSVFLLVKIAACAAFLLAGRAAAAEPTFEQFHLVLDRNIFDPARIGHDPAHARAVRPVARPAFVLVGTLFSGPESWAFFDGQDAGYRKVLKTGELIADFRVEKISANAVVLRRDNQNITLAVTQGMTQGENQAWTLAGGAGQPADGTPAAGPADPPAASVPSIPADASDTLRRLLEQRKKQLQE